jgi:NAD(P)-dependent dehydrogenase (short-subunit alcohol dehydrogenase family)
MTGQTWFVTGASRGIGLALVKQLLTRGHTVIGACRNPDGARDLWEVQGDYSTRFKSIKLDLNDPATIAQAASLLKGQTIDVLVNNAGVLLGQSGGLREFNSNDVTKSFEVNTIGPMRVTAAFLPNLESSHSPKVVNVTSLMGSIGDNTTGGYYAYRMSKNALNMFGKCLSLEFPKITTLSIHPGWVKTDMGGVQAPTEIYDSVEGIIDVICGATLKDSGRFVDFQGKVLPW